jgi:rhodanese-related sulfurtransferase
MSGRRVLALAWMGICGSVVLAMSIPCRAADAPPAAATKPVIAKVTPAEFEKLLSERDRRGSDFMVLLDVRTPEEFAQGHIAGATNLNYRAKDFGEQVAKLDKSKTYLVYCAVGGRSTSACEKMAKLDFAHLYNLDGGISRWQREGKKVEKEN